jgi:hypothetical protein
MTSDVVTVLLRSHCGRHRGPPPHRSAALPVVAVRRTAHARIRRAGHIAAPHTASAFVFLHTAAAPAGCSSPVNLTQGKTCTVRCRCAVAGDGWASRRAGSRASAVSALLTKCSLVKNMCLPFLFLSPVSLSALRLRVVRSCDRERERVAKRGHAIHAPRCRAKRNRTPLPGGACVRCMWGLCDGDQKRRRVRVRFHTSFCDGARTLVAQLSPNPDCVMTAARRLQLHLAAPAQETRRGPSWLCPHTREARSHPHLPT